MVRRGTYGAILYVFAVERKKKSKKKSHEIGGSKLRYVCKALRVLRTDEFLLKHARLRIPGHLFRWGYDTKSATDNLDLSGKNSLSEDEILMRMGLYVKSGIKGENQKN